MYIVEVVIALRWCEIEILLLQTTNRKCNVAYE